MSDMEPEISIDDNVMVVADLYGTLVSVSGSVEEMFGYSESELVGQSVELLVPEGLRTRHRDHMARYSRRPHARTMGIGMELNAAHANGSEFPDRGFAAGDQWAGSGACSCCDPASESTGRHCTGYFGFECQDQADRIDVG